MIKVLFSNMKRDSFPWCPVFVGERGEMGNSSFRIFNHASSTVATVKSTQGVQYRWILRLWPCMALCIVNRGRIFEEKELTEHRQWSTSLSIACRFDVKINTPCFDNKWKCNNYMHDPFGLKYSTEHTRKVLRSKIPYVES